MSETPRPTEQELEDAFIKITFQDEPEDQNKDPLYPRWTLKSRCLRFNSRVSVLIVASSLCTFERPTGLRVSESCCALAPMQLNSLYCRTSQLRNLYPGHTVVTSQAGTANILGYPTAYVQSLRPDLMVSESVFVPFARRIGTPGALVERVSYGCFYVVWEVGSVSTNLRRLTQSFQEI